MPSDSNAVLLPIRRWLLAGVFLLGVSVITLAHTAEVVSGYRSELIPAVVGVAGGLVALLALLRLVPSFPTAD